MKAREGVRGSEKEKDREEQRDRDAERKPAQDKATIMFN